MPCSSNANAALIAGYSLCLPFADSSEALIANLRQGKRVAACGWFASDEDAVKSGFKRNRQFARLPPEPAGLFARLTRLIDRALTQAQLDKSCLTGERARVYLTGLGPRVDARAYKSFYDRNDIDDLRVTPSIAQLQIASMSQDRLSQQLAQHYNLRYLPPNLNCASNSALAAVHIGCQAIEQGGVDRVMVINCSEITTQDFWFLETQHMLESDSVQPFGAQSNSVLFADGFCVMLLESRRHRAARRLHGGVRLRSVYDRNGAGKSHDTAYLSANLLRLMKNALRHAGLTLPQLCAIMPHGNGAAGSDKAEAQALAQLLAAHPLPLLAYKGQIGYTATGSGLIDLIIAHHALLQGELIPAQDNAAVIDALAPHLLIGGQAVTHNRPHLLKIGVSVDGALIAVVLSAERREGCADDQH